jgi:hypothetical protein
LGVGVGGAAVVVVVVVVVVVGRSVVVVVVVGRSCVRLETRKARVNIARKQASMMELKNGKRDA